MLVLAVLAVLAVLVKSEDKSEEGVLAGFFNLLGYFFSEILLRECGLSTFLFPEF